METLFLKILNLSIAASWVILAVILCRFILKNAPKWIICLLWAMVAIRLIMPFSIESAFSIAPSTKTIPATITTDEVPKIHSDIGILNSKINNILEEHFTTSNEGSTSLPSEDSLDKNNIDNTDNTAINTTLHTNNGTTIKEIVNIAAIIWIIGIIFMLLYETLSFIQLHHKVKTATLLRDNIWQSEFVSSPFILGIIKPRIYIPYTIKDECLSYILSHEHAHLKRHDHLVKPLAFLLLAVYWFNPLVWVAYVLLCRDIELACDEKVIKKLDLKERKEYSIALVENSISHRRIAACPLAFGEISVKERIKSVMNHKKPTFYVMILAIIACIAVPILLLTSPKSNNNNNTNNNAEADSLYTLKSVDINDENSHFYNTINDKARIIYADTQRVIIYQTNIFVFDIEQKKITESFDVVTFTNKYITSVDDNSEYLKLLPSVAVDGSTMYLAYLDPELCLLSSIQPYEAHRYVYAYSFDDNSIEEITSRQYADIKDEIYKCNFPEYGYEQFDDASSGIAHIEGTANYMYISTETYADYNVKLVCRSHADVISTSYPTDLGEWDILLFGENSIPAPPPIYEQYYYTDISDVEDLLFLGSNSLHFCNEHIAIVTGSYGIVVYSLDTKEVTARIPHTKLHVLGITSLDVSVSNDGNIIYIHNVNDATGEYTCTYKYDITKYTLSTHNTKEFIDTFEAVEPNEYYAQYMSWYHEYCCSNVVSYEDCFYYVRAVDYGSTYFTLNDLSLVRYDYATGEETVYTLFK